MRIVRILSLSVFSILMLSVVPCFTSCKSEPQPEPPVLEEARFVDLLTDAYLLEGFYAFQSNYHFDTLKPEMIASYDSLLAQHGISQAIFDSTVLWYTRHPDIFARVQDSVMQRLTPED